MRSFGFILIIIFTLHFSAIPQTETQKKQVEAVRAQASLEIDGNLNDPAWSEATPATEFVQIAPHFGKPASCPAEVRFLFDDNALYIGAIMFDPSPDSILKELSVRDEITNTDYFGVSIDPFNDALVSYEFYVTVAGVQIDSKNTGSGNLNDFDVDRSWDAVWYSSTRVTETGWVAELKIPYSALRFPKEQVSIWGMNAFREIRRYREHGLLRRN